MKKNKRNKALKQGVQPAAQALGDNDLMDVSGGARLGRSREYWGSRRAIDSRLADGRVDWGR